MTQTPITVTYTLAEVLGQINQKLDRMDHKIEDLHNQVIEVKLGQTRLEGEMKTLESTLTEKMNTLESTLTEKMNTLESTLTEKMKTLEFTLTEKMNSLESK